MIGAILGDIIGSPYEFDQGDKTKDFPLFSEKSTFTDDSVLTVAVAEALLEAGKEAPVPLIEAFVSEAIRRWGKMFPYAGYGFMFSDWLYNDKAGAYNSCGNGSAMRVSAAGWLYDTLERTRKVARTTANVTHNHPEGLKGAEATAAVMFLARTGKSKDEIKDYVVNEFGYDLSRTLDEIRPSYYHVETCQKTVPEAITSFLEGESFEDVIRNAVSLGGDTDTLGAIAGAMAEAYYGIPDDLRAECLERIPEGMIQVIDRFEEARGETLCKTSKHPV